MKAITKYYGMDNEDYITCTVTYVTFGTTMSEEICGVCTIEFIGSMVIFTTESGRLFAVNNFISVEYK